VLVAWSFVWSPRHICELRSRQTVAKYRIVFWILVVTYQTARCHGPRHRGMRCAPLRSHMFSIFMGICQTFDFYGLPMFSVRRINLPIKTSFSQTKLVQVLMIFIAVFCVSFFIREPVKVRKCCAVASCY